MLSNKSTVKQRIELTKPSDFLSTDGPINIDSNTATQPPRYNLRSRDSQQPSAFHKPLTEIHGSGDQLPSVSNEQNKSGLATAAYNLLRIGLVRRLWTTVIALFHLFVYLLHRL
jgi:hypothetical protein